MATIAMNSTPVPTPSTVSGRPSRLSSLNPMRSSKQLPQTPHPSSIPVPVHVQQQQLHHHQQQILQQQQQQLQQQQFQQQFQIQQQKPGGSGGSAFPFFPAGIDNDTDNFQLTRVETNRSFDSNLSTALQYKVTLNLNKHDIELIRYTWNKMLLDEPIEEKKSTLPQMPGQFPIGDVNSQNKQKTLNYIKQTSSTNVASSLFCRQLYSNLLLMEPTLEALFPSIKHQAVAFAGVISLAMSQLENISLIDDYLMKLGKRHARILCIEKPAFELFGEALIQTFHERFGLRFNQELEILWIKFYMYLANSLIHFGYDPRLRLEKNEDDNGFTTNRLEDEYEIDNMSILQDSAATRTTTFSSNQEAEASIFDRKASISTQQTSINAPSTASIFGKKGQQAFADKEKEVPAIPVDPKEKKKKLRTSIRGRTRDNCVIV